MRRLVPLVLVASLASSSSGCITYVTYASDPQPQTTALFVGFDVALGVSTGIGLARKRPDKPLWQHMALGMVGAVTIDALIALLVWQADKKE